MKITNDGPELDAIREHSDRLSVFYRALWGEHIHHGYWENGESPAAAQLKLVERLATRAGIIPGTPRVRRGVRRRRFMIQDAQYEFSGKGNDHSLL